MLVYRRVSIVTVTPTCIVPSATKCSAERNLKVAPFIAPTLMVKQPVTPRKTNTSPKKGLFQQDIFQPMIFRKDYIFVS